MKVLQFYLQRLVSPLWWRGARVEVFALLMLAIVLPAEVQGQIDSLGEIVDTVTGTEVVVSSGPYFKRRHSNSRFLPLDPREQKLQLGNNLADVLSDNGPARLNDYGAGLKTLSIDGLGSQRTNYSWQGLSLNSPSLGTIDFSLIPVYFSSGLSPYGSNYYNQIPSNQIPAPSYKKQLFLSVGSFSEYRFGLDFRRYEGRLVKEYPDYNSWSPVQLTGQVSVFIHSAKNNYPYEDERLRSSELPNAQAKVISAQLRRTLFLPKQASLSAAIWGTAAIRELPPTVGQINSQAEQEDQQLRLSLQYQTGKEIKFPYSISLAHFEELLTYKDPGQVIDSSTPTQYSSFLFKLNPRFRKSPFITELRALLTRRAASPAGGNKKEESWGDFNIRLRNKLAVDWVLHSSTGLTIGSLEKDLQFTGLLSLQFLRKPRLNLLWSRSIRRPTLNDLHWPELGRQDLAAEIINKLELRYEGESASLFYDAKLFHHRVQNAIRWLPENGQFRPRNFNRLVSSGLKGTFSFERDNWLLGSFFQYAHVQESGSDRQLPYEPRFTAGGRLRYAPERFSITYRLHYQSAVNTLAAADNQLPATWLQHIDLSYTFGAFELQLRLRNLTNLNYQRVAGYPLPGRHYRLQAVYDF